ncbi:hypothetical protein [Bacillus coahuilensis]|uniref:hypothetical protein n=1 Tax=Bacillus coahuilensis TaxID=408580 RepID=UPI0001850C63|nr:hypothetical protein [Bacillus coahuilensis]
MKNRLTKKMVAYSHLFYAMGIISHEDLEVTKEKIIDQKLESAWNLIQALFVFYLLLNAPNPLDFISFLNIETQAFSWPFFSASL